MDRRRKTSLTVIKIRGFPITYYGQAQCDETEQIVEIGKIVNKKDNKRKIHVFKREVELSQPKKKGENIIFDNPSSTA